MKKFPTIITYEIYCFHMTAKLNEAFSGCEIHVQSIDLIRQLKYMKWYI